MTDTLVSTPGERLRVSLDTEAQIITVEDTREGFVSWKIETLQSAFINDPSSGLLFNDKYRSVSRLPDWNDGSGWWEIRMNGVAPIVVTVDLTHPNSKMFFLSPGNSPLEVHA